MSLLDRINRLGLGSQESTSSLLPESNSISRIDPSESGSIMDSESPYTLAAQSKLTSISDKYSLSPDIRLWGSDLSPDLVETDDELHNPDDKEGRDVYYGGHAISPRGFANLGCLVLLCCGLVALFAVYPAITYFTQNSLSTFGGFNIGGINASGQVPSMTGNWGLIDKETPLSAHTKPSWMDSSNELQLVFSDEFNTPGRSFYPGDDPYWEAVDLHYWASALIMATNNLEWYDPAAVTTQNGSLVITLSEKSTHGLNYEGGLVSTWNKFCFTGGYIETSVELPGINDIVGLWPAVWTMGNLGRAGYGASLEGMWPYTYDSCDVGTAPNQTVNGLPLAATVNGDRSNGGVLSYLPGQKLSRCTCAGESHPGPAHADGTYVGRSAPEIDIFEAQVTGDPLRGDPLTGQVSQSAQWAPFNAGYEWFNNTNNMVIYDTTISEQNLYIGSVWQQATSVVTDTDSNCYEYDSGCYSIYGFEYVPGFDESYITWISNNQRSWTLNVAGMAADSAVEISARPIPQEPMYIIANLGMSTNFGHVDLQHLTFPAHMRVDYIRVYQPKNAINIGCDPKDFPTTAYINEYSRAYTDANLTTWRDDFGQPFPKNSFLGQC